MPSTVDAIVEGFPFPILTPIVGEPNYESIAALHNQLNANAASIPSHLGNGQLGLLSLTVSAAVYGTLSTVAFVPPVNPGTDATIEGDNPTAAQIADARFLWASEAKLFKDYNSADKALKQLLLGAVDEMFVKSLQTQYVGYLNVSTRDILDHLYAQYARISASALAEADAIFKTAYNVNLPIETLFDQIQTGIDFAAAGLTPYTNAQVLATAYQLIFTTGLFLEPCRVWNRRDAGYKTWAQFKIDFALSHREFREARVTTAGATDYANNATSDVHEGASLVDHHEETLDALANLATATAHDRQSVATLTETNSLLTKELTTINAQLVTALLANTKLTRLLNTTKTSEPTDPRFEARHYCWSCGYKCLHWSSQCPTPKDGHQKLAKASDTKGGSTKNK